jgi:type II secretory pathway component PulF
VRGHRAESAFRFLILLEPAVILGMGVLVGFIVFSMFLAIFRLNEVPF